MQNRLYLKLIRKILYNNLKSKNTNKLVFIYYKKNKIY